HVTSSSVLGAPQYVASAASAAFAGIAGLDVSYGPALTVAAVAGIALLAHRRAAAGRPLLPAAVAGAVAFWGLSAVARATEAEQAAPQILAGPYLAAARDFGTPALTLAEVQRAPASTRAGIDQTIEHAENTAAGPGSNPPCSPAAGPATATVAPGRRLVIRAL